LRFGAAILPRTGTLRPLPATHVSNVMDVRYYLLKREGVSTARLNFGKWGFRGSVEAGFRRVRRPGTEVHVDREGVIHEVHWRKRPANHTIGENEDLTGRIWQDFRPRQV
jgi:hypothetical protein